MTERFTLLSELGRGGMGVVWRARDEETGQIVALKLLREVYAEDPDYLARFERELELARRIDSAYVVKVLGFGVRGKVPYLALEYVDGPSLHAALVSHGPYSWPETRAILTQLTQGLADAHAAGVVHRDVKPSNVLIGPHGVAKLTDFGIARGLDTTRITATSTMLGTPAYLAPEGPKDARSDLYSLGIIGYELLTGTVPFKGTSHQEVIFEHVRTPPDLSRLPAEARPIIGMLMAKDPAARPRRASALLPILYGVAPVPSAQTPVAQASPMQPVVGIAPTPQAVRAELTPPSPPANAPGQPIHPAADGTGRASIRSPAPSRRRSAPLIAILGSLGVIVCVVVAAFAAGFLPPRRSSGPGTFSPTGSMTTARDFHTATLLSDGRVLISGGNDVSTPQTSAELYDPKTGTFSLTGSMTTARSHHTATSLSDGRVLTAGGWDGSTAQASAELYDPKTGSFSPTGSMGTERSSHTATLLYDGRVLIAGGGDPNDAKNIPLTSAELYDPATGEFNSTGSMATTHANGTATSLSDGRVLIAGGDTLSGVQTSAELYDPKTGSFSPTGSMGTERSYHTATLLSDGRVLIAGGLDSSATQASAELYDPRTGTFSPTGSMATARTNNTATLLSNARVLMAGGDGGSGAETSAELYDPKTGSFSPTGSMGTERSSHTATLVSDGRVLIAGSFYSPGGSSAELYTP